MATQTNQQYHLEKQHTAIKQTRDFIHTNSLVDQRRRDPSYKGMQQNPLANGGERANVFMAIPQNHKPLSVLSGGVLQDDSYRRQILEQRKRDYEIQEAIQESLPLPPVQAPALSEEDTKKLELNSLLDQLYETINSNVQEVSSVGELLRKINRLVLALAITMDGGDIGELLDVFTDLLSVIVAKISDKTPASPLDAEPLGALRFMERSLTVMTGFLKDISGSVERGEKDYRLAIQAAAKRHFGKEAVKLVQPSIKSAAEVYSAPSEITQKRVTKKELIQKIRNSGVGVSEDEEKRLIQSKTVPQIKELVRRAEIAKADMTRDTSSAATAAAPIEGQGMSGGADAGIPTLTITEKPMLLPPGTDPAIYALRKGFPPQKIRRRKGGADEDPTKPQDYTEDELIEMIARLIHERDGLVADTNPATAAARSKRRKEITKQLRKYKDLLGDMAEDPRGAGRRVQKKKRTSK